MAGKLTAQWKDERAMAVLAMAVGLSAWYLGSNWVSTLTYDASGHYWWLNRSGAEILAIAALVPFFDRIRLSPAIRILDGCFALAYAASIAILASPLGQDPLFVALALVGFGAGQIWMMARWSDRLASAATTDLVAALLASVLIVAFAKMSLVLIPLEVGSALMALVPLLAAAMLVFHQCDASPPARLWFTRASAPSFTPLALAMGAFFLMWSILNFILKRQTGHYSAGASASVGYTFFSQALLAAFVLALAWWVFAKKGSLDITFVWKLSYTLAAAALFLFALLGTAQVIQAFTSAAVIIAKMFLWLALVDVARHSSYPPWRIVCLGQLLYATPDCLGRAAASGLSLASVSSITVAGLLLGIVAIVAFCLPERSPAAMNLLSDLSQAPTHPSDDGDAINRHCEALGAERGLSHREIEILQHLCKGRSRPYIAETLYLSENTVRTHSKRIYQKLDVHTRQELIDLISAPNAR